MQHTSTTRQSRLSLEVRRALGPIATVCDVPGLRDVLVQIHNGAGEVWIDRSGSIERLREVSLTPAAVRELAVALVAAGGRALDELHPCANVHIGAGVRAHAVLPPISVAGPAVSIRFPEEQPLSFDELIARGLCDARVEMQLRSAVQARKNILITGGTGSGKTTLLTALLRLVPPSERIVTIEDVAELRPEHPHHVALESRPANAEGTGEVTLDQLLRESLRMRPDRIVLGECRGAEIATLLTALNTGHDGGAGTLHANRLADVPARLEALGMLAGYPAETLARQTVSALHLVVHLERVAGVGHRVRALGQFTLDGERLAVTS